MTKEETNSYLAKRLKQRDNRNKDEDGQGEEEEAAPIDEQQHVNVDTLRLADGD